jgi:hypothetical protein
MPSRPADLAHLSLMVARLLDADLLPTGEGGALLAEIEAARRSLNEEDEQAARWHTERFLLALEALLQSGLLDEADGRAGLESARRILEAPAR